MNLPTLEGPMSDDVRLTDAVSATVQQLSVAAKILSANGAMLPQAYAKPEVVVALAQILAMNLTGGETGSRAAPKR